MPMVLRSICLAAALAGVVACTGDRDTERARTDALAARVDQLEKRLAAAERGVEPVERTRNDVASLDRRVSVVETSVRELAARPAAAPPAATAVPGSGAPAAVARPGAASGPAAWGGPTTREVRQDRRSRLRALSDEFRARLARLHQQSQANPGVDQQQQIQDTLQWFREQRRAVLRGDTAGGR